MILTESHKERKKERDHWEDLDIDGSTILKGILAK
jgi:hypothetical protein